MTYERPIEFTARGFPISGTMALPDAPGPHPVVILIPGSGPLDRNENHSKIKLNCFNTFANHLSEAGFASIRYDKIGIGKSSGDYYRCGFIDNVATARAACEYSASSPSLDDTRLFLLGHSEGALIATRLATEAPPGLRGAILLAGTASPGERIVRWQAKRALREMPKAFKSLLKCLGINPLKSQQKLLEQIKSSDAAVLRYRFLLKINAKWFREFLAYNPAGDFPHITRPLLAITGDKDLQTPVFELEKMARLAGGVIETYRIPQLTHILRRDFTAPSLKHYPELVKNPIDSEVVAIVLNWLRRHTFQACGEA